MNDHIIQFNRGDITQNLTIQINDDNECEDDKNENFFCNLTLVSRISDINVKIHQASVSINDYNEGECVPTLSPQPSYKTLTTSNSGSGTMSPTDSPNDAQTSTATVITAGVVVVAVVLIIAIAVVIVSIAALVLRNHQQKNSLKNAANMYVF